MLESARILLEIFAARLENCSKYLLLGSARLGFYLKLNCSKMLGSVFKFPARRALVSMGVRYRALRAVLEIGNSSIFEQFRAVFTDFCSKMLGSNIVKLLEKNPLLEIARIIKKRSKF